MAAKKTQFKANPIDADGDGIVQEGTPWERPIEPEFTDEEQFLEATGVELPKAKTHVVVDGDSYASIAAKHLPAGMTKHEYAQELVAKNGALALGREIIL